MFDQRDEAGSRRRKDSHVYWSFKNVFLRAVAFGLSTAALSTSIANACQPGSCASAAELKTASERPSYREGRKAMRRGNHAAAAKIYEQLIALKPSDHNARLGLSFSYFKMSDYARCFETASEVLKSEPSNARAHALTGVALLRSGYLKKAAVELQSSVNLDPKEALAYGGAPELDYYEGRVTESRRKSIYAHQLDPDEPDYLITYARSSSRAEDFKEAVDAYELFLQVAPANDGERRDRIRGLISLYRQLSGLKIHQIAGAEATEAPFHLGDDRRPFLRVKLNGRDALFVVDTGSGFTVISREAAKRFGVSEIAKGGKSQGVGGPGKFPIVYGLIRSIDIGAATVRMVPCFIRAFHGNQEREAGERADGFIGLSILSHYLTELDYKERKLRLNRRTGSSLPAAGPDVAVVPFRTTQNGLMSVETELDGKNTVNIILDSGASSMVISAAAVERLKLHDQLIKGTTKSVIGAAGVTHNVEVLFIRNCKVADIEQRNLEALVMDFNAINETSGFEQSGILGGDFLQHFRLTIDFNRAQVAFRRQSQATPD
jgi:predicted aspartyl protease